MKHARRLEVVKAWFAALAENDFDSMHAFHTDDIVWDLMPGPAEATVPWTGHFEGRAGVDECLRRYEKVRSERFTIEEPLVRADGTITVPGRSDYVVNESGEHFTIEFVEYFQFSGDRISYVKVYGDTADATRALARGRERRDP